MNTLWTFGDSFTDFFKPPQNSGNHWRHKYIEWKGYIPKVYGEIISEKLNMDFINKGKGGCDNNHIFEEFCEVSKLIKENDIVIFGWTNQQRIRLATKNNKWGFFNPEKKTNNGFFAHIPLSEFDFISESTIQEMLINKESTLYLKELNNWIKLINLALKNIKTIHWGWDEKINNTSAIYIKGYETIKTETNGMVDDGHWCEDGHIKFADFLINVINNNINLNKLL